MKFEQYSPDGEELLGKYSFWKITSIIFAYIFHYTKYGKLAHRLNSLDVGDSITLEFGSIVKRVE